MSKFLVYRASAGSGKTFTLVRKYLEQVLAVPDDYRRILAVTFTNKAADEMKSRVLEELDLLGKTPQDSKHLDYLTKTLGKPASGIQYSANTVKSRMLHDYSRISVGTIDKFFQQVLRSFARESGLSSTFEIQLDSDLVLERFSEYIFNQANSDPALMSWLVDWVNERMENKETWHKLEADLVRLGKELLKEDILASFVSDPDQIPSPEVISRLKGTCRKVIHDFNEAKARIAKSAESIIDSSGLSVSDFSYGKSGPAGTLVRLESSKEGPKTRANEALDNPEKWVAKKSPPAIRNEILNNLYSKLNPLLNDSIELFGERFRVYNTAQAVNRNLYALGFAALLFDYFREYFNENDQLLLSLSQPLVNQIIGDNPSPFIYEKTGTYFNHFLIDEFQDTSDLQWKNFKPLIIDSLSTDGLSMIVGDIKQSLYRWRNSNWRLLHEKAIADLHSFRSDFFPLDTNQRSRESIIAFNNRIFSALPGQVSVHLGSTDPDIIGKVFREAHQEPGGRAGLAGRVEVRFIAKNVEGVDWREELSTHLPEMVEDLLENRGYRQEDITFLVRKNADADKITAILSGRGKNWTFISSDVFRIGNSPVIRIILNALRYLADPRLTLYRDLFLWDVHSRIHPGEAPVPGFRLSDAEAFVSLINSLRYNDLLTITDALISAYRLDEQETDLAYIFQFRDQVKGCMNRGVSHPDGFMSWWEASGHKQMLVAETIGSSMRIMTIHKAKGLSSPVVIIPYCNWDFNHSAQRAPWIWVPTEGTLFEEVPRIPVRYSTLLEQSAFEAGYRNEKADCYLDNLNLLYVAFTRAIDVLIVFCPYGKGMKTVAEALYECLKDELSEESVFRLGDPDFRNQVIAGQQVNEIHLKTPMITGKLKSRITNRSEEELPGTRFGKNVHHVLETVHTRADLEISLERSVNAGFFSSEEAHLVETGLMRLFEIPEISEWFSGQWQIWNETGILVPGKGERRPDRVMFRDGKVVIIDYKTGIPEPKHENQVATYMNLISAMGYPDIRGYLLYLENARLIEVRSQGDFFQPDLFGQ